MPTNTSDETDGRTAGVQLAVKNAIAPQSLPARARASMTGRLAWVWGLLLGALQCKRVSAESFSNSIVLQAAVDKVVAGTWSGDDISLWDVSGVDNMQCVCVARGEQRGADACWTAAVC